MIVVRNLQSTQQICYPAIRELVQQRINDLGGDAFDATELGFFIVLETGDTLKAINEQLGFDILCNRWTGLRYDHANFTPSFEFVEQIGAVFDAVWVLDDSGFAVELIFETDGVHPELLAMCRMFAISSPPEETP